MVKIRVIHDFYDAENDLKLRTEGEILETSEERAEYLIRMKVAEKAEEENNDPVSADETQN